MIRLVHEGDLGITGREAFLCPSGEAQHHLYVLAPEEAELRRHVVFRDALRADPALRDAYAALKRSLAEKHAHDRATYNAGKSASILATLGAPADLTGNAANPSPGRPRKTKSTPNEIRIGNFGTGSDTDAVKPQKPTFLFAHRKGAKCQY